MPDGRAAIATNAPAWLATGGSGDVLAGLIIGLLVQDATPGLRRRPGSGSRALVPAAAGRGMVAEDLPDVLPQVLAGL